MAIFRAPKDFSADVRLTRQAPWLKQDQVFEPLPDNADDSADASFPIELQGQNAGESLVHKLSYMQMRIKATVAVGFIAIFGGVGLIYFSGALAKSYNVSFPLIIVVGFVAFVLSCLLLVKSNKATERHNEIFKNQLIRSRLKKCFDVKDYVYNGEEKYKPSLTTFLQSLGIKENVWNELTYNDYFRGAYKQSPFIFIDCQLVKGESGRNPTGNTMFKGQIIVFQLNRRLTYQGLGYRVMMKMADADDQHPSQEKQDYILRVETCDGFSSSVSSLFSRECVISDQNPIDSFTKSEVSVDKMITDLNLNLTRMSVIQDALDQETDPKKILQLKIKKRQMLEDMVEIQNKLSQLEKEPMVSVEELKKKIAEMEADEDMDAEKLGVDMRSMPTKQLLRFQKRVWFDIRDAAQCETAIVVYGSHLVIIMQNNFDPFEFGFQDMFTSDTKLIEKIDRQVSWLWSVIRPLEATGWIG